jgi:hypothetical protein
MSTISQYIGTSARTNVEQAIAKAKENEAFNAVLSLSEERALKRADQVDRGEILGRLAGVPFIAKDNFLTLGGTTTAASEFLKDFKAPLQARVRFVLAKRTSMLLRMGEAPRTLLLVRPRMLLTRNGLPEDRAVGRRLWSRWTLCHLHWEAIRAVLSASQRALTVLSA